MKVYYAHSKKIYDTSREKRERDLLRFLFGTVLCPNRDIGERGSIRPYLEAISRCDQLVASEFLEHVGRGVFDEVNYARRKGFKVLVLRDEELITVLGTKIVDPNDWTVHYGRLITKIPEALTL